MTTLQSRTNACAALFRDLGLEGVNEVVALRQIQGRGYTPDQQRAFELAFMNGRIERCREMGKSAEVARLERRLAKVKK